MVATATGMKPASRSWNSRFSRTRFGRAGKRRTPRTAPKRAHFLAGEAADPRVPVEPIDLVEAEGEDRHHGELPNRYREERLLLAGVEAVEIGAGENGCRGHLRRPLLRSLIRIGRARLAISGFSGLFQALDLGEPGLAEAADGQLGAVEGWGRFVGLGVAWQVPRGVGEPPGFLLVAALALRERPLDRRAVAEGDVDLVDQDPVDRAGEVGGPFVRSVRGIDPVEADGGRDDGVAGGVGVALLESLAVEAGVDREQAGGLHPVDGEGALGGLQVGCPLLAARGRPADLLDLLLAAGEPAPPGRALVLEREPDVPGKRAPVVALGAVGVRVQADVEA
jgi:hypothetical protein